MPGVQCVICLSADTSAEEWCVLKECGHVFHTHCLLQSLEHARKCPQCRVSGGAVEGCEQPAALDVVCACGIRGPTKCCRQGLAARRWRCRYQRCTHAARTQLLLLCCIVADGVQPAQVWHQQPALPAALLRVFNRAGVAAATAAWRLRDGRGRRGRQRQWCRHGHAAAGIPTSERSPAVACLWLAGWPALCRLNNVGCRCSAITAAARALTQHSSLLHSAGPAA